MSKTYPCPNGIEDDCGYPACAHAMQCERASQERLARALFSRSLHAMKCLRCEKRPAQPLHYLCRECYAEDDGEPRNPGEEIKRLTRERDEARAKAEEFRRYLTTRITKDDAIPLFIPWENAKGQATAPSDPD